MKWLLVASASLLVITGSAAAQGCATYRNELLRMREADEGIRSEWPAAMASDDFANSRAVRMADVVDRKNTANLKQLIARCGWPRPSAVGADAAKGAWLIVQHADFDVPFQTRVLSMLRQGFAKGGVDAEQLALLEDRVATAGDRPQIYGTQFEVVPPCGLKQLPVKDPADVDKRRSKLGLMPLAEYKQKVAETILPQHCTAPSSVSEATGK